MIIYGKLDFCNAFEHKQNTLKDISFKIILCTFSHDQKQNLKQSLKNKCHTI